METAYGDPGALPTRADVIAYLTWVRERRGRSR